MSGPTASRPSASSATLATLVARREITAQLRSRAFVVSTVILLVAIVLGIVLGSILSKHLSHETPPGGPQAVAVVPGTQSSLAGLPGITVVQAADAAAARALVQDGKVVAALLPDSGPAGDLWHHRSLPRSFRSRKPRRPAGARRAQGGRAAVEPPAAVDAGAAALRRAAARR